MKYNTYRIKIEYLNYTKILNYFFNKDIEIANLDTEKNKMSFDINKKDLNFVLNYLNDNNINHEIINSNNFKNYLNAFLKKSGMIVSVFVLCIVLVFANMFTWKININGNEKVAEKKILNILKKNHIEIGKIGGDIENAKKDIRDIKDIVDVSIKKKGIITYVDIFETDNKAEVEKTYSDPVISMYDAKITNIILHCGTSQVKIGDVVKKGKELVSPYILSSTGEKLRDSAAQAEIYGEVILNSSLEILKKEPQFISTGKIFKSTSLNFLGFKWKGGKNKFAITKSKTIAQKTFLLPINLETVYYYEQKLVYKQNTKEDAIEKAKNQIVERLILKANGEIKNCSITTNETENSYKVNVVITAKMQIGQNIKKVDNI